MASTKVGSREWRRDGAVPQDDLDAIRDGVIAYGRQQGARGAVFYFNRTTKQPLEFPAVRDYVGNRRNTESVMIVSNAAQLGRFWIGQDGL